MELGSKIRKLRKARKMTLVELSESSGVQLATLSRIENNKMTGTLESHMNIARALGINLAELLTGIDNQESNVDLLSKQEHTDVFVHSDSSSFEMLTTKVLDKKMMPILLKIQPGGSTNPEQASFSTQKFIYVLEGKLEISIADKKYALESGATLYFDASAMHSYKNIGDTLARAICVMTPPAL